MTSDRVIELRGMCIRTKERVLVRDVDLDVEAGEVTALVGVSGAGKSLTARCIMGVIDVVPGLAGGSLRYPAFSGDRDWFDGYVDSGSRGMRKLLRETATLRGAYFTYSPQGASSALNPGRTVGRQIALALARREQPVENVGQTVGQVLHSVGLDPRSASALPSELSGGQCQRAALAIAVAPLPRLVIADEPETGLDPVLRRTVLELLAKVCRDYDAGLLLISHHEETVRRMADRVVRLTPVKEAA